MMMIGIRKMLYNTGVKYVVSVLLCTGLFAGCSIQHPTPSGSGADVPPVSPDSSANIRTPVESNSPGISAQPSQQPANDRQAQPPLLTQYIQSFGVTYSELSFSQLILVIAGGSDATVYCYDKSETGIWTVNSDIGSVYGHVGKNGVSASKREGDGCTPIGLYPIGFSFGIYPKPDTAMEYKRITDRSYWVDDPGSGHYNEWVEGDGNVDWSSAEKLSEYKNSYAYAVVIEYNMDPIVPGDGSAIFFHCGEKPTVGCVSVPQQKVLQILKWLNPDKEPNILIVAA